uniref:Uncharacterized protein n=1 Tax=Haemonchus contortus TaxID=6289 RepID=W6NCQ3_HAECO
MFASSTSPLFLLGIAVDRLFSLMRFYKPMIASYSRLYIVAHTLPGCILGTALDVIVLTNQKQEEKVICSLTAPMQGPVHSAAQHLFKSNYSCMRPNCAMQCVLHIPLEEASS